MIKIITCISENGEALVIANHEEADNPSEGERQVAEELKPIVAAIVGAYLQKMSDEQTEAGAHPIHQVMQRGKVLSMGESYLTVQEPDKTLAIICLKCGRKSTHPQDVENKYCGACHTYHEATQSKF